MKKLRNRIVMAVLISVIMIASVNISNMQKLPGTLNESVEVLEYALDEGGITEEYVMENIRNGALNDPHGIGQMLYQGYLSSYKDTLIAEGYVTQEDIEWGKWFVDTYLGGTGSSNEQSTPEPEPTPQPEQKPVEEQQKPELEQTTETVVQNDPVVEETAPEETKLETPKEEAETEETEPVKEIKFPEPTVSEWTEVERVEATCTADGYILYQNGLEEEKRDILPKLGHSYSSEETTAATCTIEGAITYTCKVCGDSYTEPTEIKPHDNVETITPAGWFETGLKTVSCRVCGEVAEETILPQTCPLPLYVCGIIAGAAVLLVIGIVVLCVRKKKK